MPITRGGLLLVNWLGGAGGEGSVDHGFILTMRPARSEDGSAHGWTDYATRTVWVNSSLMTGCPDGPVRATRNAQ